MGGTALNGERFLKELDLLKRTRPADLNAGLSNAGVANTENWDELFFAIGLRPPPRNKRRTMISETVSNLIQTAMYSGEFEAGGTSTNAGTKPRTITYAVTSTGSTVRIFAAFYMTGLTAGKYYEASATVLSANFANPGAMTKKYFMTNGNASPATGLLMSSPPIPGSRVGFRFQLTLGTTIDLRWGIGCDAGENATAGDSFVLSDFQLSEVPGLAGSILPFVDNSSFGPVGDVAAADDPIGSCVLCCGDSWMNGTTDIGGLLGSTYGREVVIVATAGHTLTNISAALLAAIATGKGYLNSPNFHVPGIAVIEGGVNDLVGDVTGAAMWSTMLGILDKVQSMGMVPIVILPTLANDGSYYTSGREAENTAYRRLVFLSGVAVLDSAEYCLLSTGAANTTYLISEGGNWIHPSEAGYALLAKKLDELIRIVEMQYQIIQAPATWL